MSYFSISTTLNYLCHGVGKSPRHSPIHHTSYLLDCYPVAYPQCRHYFSSRKASASFNCAVGCVGSPCGSQIKVTSVISPQQYLPVIDSGTNEATWQHTMS